MLAAIDRDELPAAAARMLQAVETAIAETGNEWVTRAEINNGLPETVRRKMLNSEDIAHLEWLIATGYLEKEKPAGERAHFYRILPDESL